MPSFGRRRSLPGLVAAVALLAAGVAGPAPAANAAPASFVFGLIGDTGYTAGQDTDLIAVRRSMAKFPLAFETHDGDIAEEGEACSDSRLQYVKGVFDGFTAPFVYTPGDNEWTDCSGPSARLAAIRKIFFSTSQTLGKSRMSVTRQSGTPENARWSRNDVWFATLNVPGPRGSGGPTSADVKWLGTTFDAAEKAGAAGVMIIQQDNPFSGGTPAELLSALKSRTVEFGRPVVLVHGDTHTHRIDKPWKDVPNFTRVETYGDTSARKWVEATVDPASAAVFSFKSISG
jgi:hypothetical protein